MTKLDYNKKMVGKKVEIVSGDYAGNVGIVNSVKNQDTFIVEIDGRNVEIDIYEIRHLN